MRLVFMASTFVGFLAFVGGYEVGGNRTTKHLREALHQQNACIEAWAAEVSKLDTTNERMCEFMVANRLICEVQVP